MIAGIDINFLIKVALGLCAIWLLALLAIWIFLGSAAAKKFLHYSGKFWWAALAIIGIAAATSRKRNQKLDSVNSKIEELQRIENKTKEDEAKLRQLEEEKRKIEEEIQRKTDEYRDKLDKLENKPDKPGDAGRSSDNMNDAWRR